MSEDQRKQMISNLRVLDESAYEELSAKLDTLIAQAAASGRELDELFNRNRTVNSESEQARTELDKRLVVSARVLKITKEQLNQVALAVKALGSRHERIDELSEEVKSQLGRFHAHADSAVKQIDTRVAGALEGLTRYRQTSEEDRSRADRLLKTATSLGERVADLQEQLTSGIATFENGLQRTLTDLDRARSQAQRASSTLDEQVFALKSRISSLSGSPGGRRQTDSSGVDLDDLRRQLDQLSRGLGDRIRQMEDHVASGIADLQGARQQTIDAVRSAVAQLATRIEEAGDAGGDNGAAVNELRSQLEASISGLEQRLAPRLSELNAQSAESVGRIEQRIAEFQEQLEAVSRKLEHPGDDVGARVTELADSHRQLAGAVEQLGELVHPERVEQQMEGVKDALAALGKHDPDAGLAEGLDSLKQHLDKIAEQVDTRLTAALSDLGERPEPETGLAEGLEDLKQRLEAIGEQVDARLTAALADLEERALHSGDDAAAKMSALAGGQESLTAAVRRLQEQLAKSHAELPDTNDGAPDPQQAERVERHLVGIKELLAGVSGRIDDLHESGAGADRQEQGGAVAEGLADLARQINGLSDGLEARLAEAVAGLAGDGPADDGAARRMSGIEQQLGDLAAQLSAVHARLEEQVAPVLVSLQKQGGNGAVEGSLADISKQLGEMAQQLNQRGPEGDGQEWMSRLASNNELLMGAVERIEDQLALAISRKGEKSGKGGKGKGATGAGDTDRIEEHIIGLKELLAGVSGRIEDVLEGNHRGNGSGEGLTRGLETLREQVDERWAEVLSRLDTIEVRGGAASPPADGSATEPGGGGMPAHLDRKLTDLANQLTAMGREIARINAPGASGGGQTAAAVSQLAVVQEQLAGAVDRLDEKLSNFAIRPGTPQPQPDNEQGPRVEEHLVGLKELLAGVAGRVEDLLDRPAGVKELREHMDERLTQILAHLELRGPGGKGMDPDQISQLAGTQAQLTTAVGKLQEQLSTALADPGSRISRNEERISGVDERLSDLSKQVSAVGEQIAGELQAQLGSFTEQVEQRMAAALTESPDAKPTAKEGKAAKPAKKPASKAPDKKKPQVKGPQRYVPALINAINSGDEREMRKFVVMEYSESALSERSIEDRVKVFMSFAGEAGKISLCQIDDSDPNEVVALVQENESPQRHRVSFAIDSTPPNKIYIINIDAL